MHLHTVIALLLVAVLAQGRSGDAAAQRDSNAAAATSSALRLSDTPLSPRTRSSGRSWQEPFEQFHSNRILWTYNGPAIIAEAGSKGIPVQCAVDFWVPETHPRKEEMACTDRNGAYGGPRNDAKQRAGVLRRPDINTSAWREYQLGRVQGLVDAGCRSFQQDNPWLNYLLARTGGCYTPESLAKFREHLRKSLDRAQLAALGISNVETFDYRTVQSPALAKHFLEFQKEATRQYHEWLHAEAKRYAQAKHSGQPITFSANLLIRQLRDGASSWLFPHFDFLLSEAHGDRDSMPSLLRELSGWARKFPLAGGVTFVSNDAWLNRRSIATAYSFGLVPIAPWDVYIAAQQPRYYGDPADYAPLFRMVRANPAAFDGYESEQDWFGTDGPVGAAQGYVRNVERSSGDGTLLVQVEGPELAELPPGTVLTIGGKKHQLSGPSRQGAFRLAAGAAVAIGEPVSRADVPVQYLVSVRRSARDPKRKTVHVVNWGDMRGRYLVLKQSLFASAPALAITPDASTPAPASPRAVGDYLVYSLADAVWTVLY